MPTHPGHPAQTSAAAPEDPLLADLQFDGQELSALCDGEMDEATLSRGLAAWQNDGAVRQRWHDYHLVGDVLRSADLAHPAASKHGDEAWLGQLRSRLLAEPSPGVATAQRADANAAASGLVDLPPQLETAPADSGHQVLPLRAQPLPGSAGSRRRQLWRRWSMPAGIAAGVALVGGLVLMNNSRLNPEDDAGLALGNSSDLVPVRQLPLGNAPSSRIDSYLAAHQQFQQRMPVSAPLRSVAFEVSPER